MTETIKLIFFVIATNVISLMMWRRIFFNNEFKKSPLNFFKGIFLFTCNTFFTIVLYSKVQGVCLLANLSYMLCLEWISFKDIKDKQITNKSNILLLVLGIVCLLLMKVSIKQIGTNLIIAGGMFILGLLIRLISRKQIGGGDIKMLVALAARFNIFEMIKIIVISIFLGAIYASYLLIFKKKNKDYRFAFGEFIALGVLLII